MPVHQPRGYVRMYVNNGSQLARVPQSIGKHLPADQVYKVELNDEGILFRPVSTSAIAEIQQTLPAWARRSEAGE